jgi:hypothetical protein
MAGTQKGKHDYHEQPSLPSKEHLALWEAPEQQIVQVDVGQHRIPWRASKAEIK